MLPPHRQTPATASTAIICPSPSGRETHPPARHTSACNASPGQASIWSRPPGRPAPRRPPPSDHQPHNPKATAAPLPIRCRHNIPQFRSSAAGVMPVHPASPSARCREQPHRPLQDSPMKRPCRQPLAVRNRGRPAIATHQKAAPKPRRPGPRASMPSVQWQCSLPHPRRLDHPALAVCRHHGFPSSWRPRFAAHSRNLVPKAKSTPAACFFKASNLKSKAKPLNGLDYERLSTWHHPWHAPPSCLMVLRRPAPRPICGGT